MNVSLNLFKKKQVEIYDFNQEKAINLHSRQFNFQKRLEIHDLAFIKKSNSFKFLKKSNVTNKWINWINKVDLESTVLTKTKSPDSNIQNQKLTLNTISKSGYSKLHELKLVTINIASPEKIKEWAETIRPNGKIFGEVTNANTLHYKTFKPHKGGLFCERIFGPLKDFECACGIRSKPTELESKKILEHEQTTRNFCPTCDVEYTWSVLRRYQLGYIQLVSPVSHIWFLKANPSYLSLLLDLRRSHLESIIYCTNSITLEHLWKSSQNLGLDTSPSILYSIWQKLLEEEKFMKKKKLHIKSLIKNSNFSFLVNQKEKKLKKRLYFMYKYKQHSQYYENFPTLNLNMTEISAFNLNLKNSKKLNSIQNSLYAYKKLNSFLKKKIGLNKQSKKILTTYSKMIKFMYQKSFLQALQLSKKSFLFSLKIAFLKNLLNDKKYTSFFENNKFERVEIIDFNQEKEIFFESMKCLFQTKKNFKTSLTFIPNFNVYEKKVFNFKKDFLELAEGFLQIHFLKFFMYNQKQFFDDAQFNSKAIENNYKMLFDSKNSEIFKDLYYKIYKNFPSERNSLKRILFEFLTFSNLFFKLNAYNKKTPFKILTSVLKTKNLFIIKKENNFDSIDFYNYTSFFDFKSQFSVPSKIQKEVEIYDFNQETEKPSRMDISHLKKQNKNYKKIKKISSKIKKEINHRQKFLYFSGFSIENKVVKLDSFFEKNKKKKFLKFLYKKFNQNKLFLPPRQTSFVFEKNEVFFKDKQEKEEKNLSNSFSLKNFDFIHQIKSKVDLLIPHKNKKSFNKSLDLIYNYFIQNKNVILLDPFSQKPEFLNSWEKNVFYQINKDKENSINLKSLILQPKQNEIYFLTFSYLVKFYMESHKSKLSDMLHFINFIYYLKLPFTSQNNLTKTKLHLSSFSSNQDAFAQNIENVLKKQSFVIPSTDFQNFKFKKKTKTLFTSVKKNSIVDKSSLVSSTDSRKKQNKLHRYLLSKDIENDVFFGKEAVEINDFKLKSMISNKSQLKSMILNKRKKESFFSSKKTKKKNFYHNSLYTISYSHLWSYNADWKSFFYYNSAPKDFEDVSIYSYNQDNFLDQEYFTKTNELILKMQSPIAGAAMVKKLLSDYDSTELKKMVKQHQVLLPKLNSYIRQLKEKAIKKFDFVRIQKLLNKRDHIIRRLKLIRKFSHKNVDPTSMILSVLPVLPPDLRPILKLENQIAASDLNRLYQRILFRNERLKKFLKDPSTSQSFEMKYAQRLLQESVDNLIQNGKGNVKPETNSRGQALKSLSEILKGKQGRFRQYLLGKRVDYSGRSVIVVGPKLKLYECGLPKEMAIELFLPFLIKRILHYKIARTVIGAKNFLYSNKTYCLNLLYEIMKNHPVLLNRAPTLHRLGIQAFRPKLVEGRAILLHPLVCPAFNADFDGDQMAVHVPITVEARAEAWSLLFSRNHLISPATGDPIILPSQDMVLGCYYLTSEKNLLNNKRKDFSQKFVNKAENNVLLDKKSDFSSELKVEINDFNQNSLISTKRKKVQLTNPTIHSLQHFSPCFINFEKILNAYQLGNVSLQEIVWLKWNGNTQFVNEPISLIEIRLINNGSRYKIQSKSYQRVDKKGKIQNQYIRTTPGRILINSITQQLINL